MPTPSECKKCDRPYYGAAGMLCRECERDAERPSDATTCSVTDSGARILHKEDVILALMGVGLGAKLINEALENLGFRLDAFPSQNDTAQATPTKRP